MQTFEDLFQKQPAVTTDAPGRVNLIGEHTDYNGGFVLPTPIPQRTRVQLSPRDDRHVRAASVRIGPVIEAYDLGNEQIGRGWLDYLQGVTQLLVQAGHQIRGFDVFITSDVPVGSGLSSSAALDVALLRALRSAFDLKLDDLQIALIGQKVENAFVGAQVGIMDPMVASLGENGSALFIDARTLNYERIALPTAADLVVINSGVAHDHAAGDYNTRRAECEQVCRLLNVQQLRELSAADLPRVNALPDPLNRRARHVITENDRVLQTIVAFRANDLTQIGMLFQASHQSMRNDYQISIPEIDLLVELARRDADVYGARLTGGGFGGSIVLLARGDCGEAVARSLAQRYAHETGRTPAVLVPALKEFVRE